MATLTFPKAARPDAPDHQKSLPGVQSLTPQMLRQTWRRRLLVLLGVAMVVAAIAAALWWYLVLASVVSTDDAYVGASVADITPLVNGPVRDVMVHDTQSVRRGDVLVVIDPADLEIAHAQAAANYAEAVRHVRQAFASAEAARALVTARQADLKRARLDNDRRAALAATGAVSGDELSMARNALDTASAGLGAAQGQLAAQLAMIQGRSVDENPEVLAAKAALDAANLALSRTVIRAPVDGIVAQSQVQIGQRVEVGTTLMTVVPISQVYVDANFKEGELRRIRIGQPVTLTSDLYGSGVVFHGRVAGVGGGTGSAFALIPAQNATGNWIKVVQRLPVRIALDEKELARHPLRVGLSMVASISAVGEPEKPMRPAPAKRPLSPPAVGVASRISGAPPKMDAVGEMKPAVDAAESDTETSASPPESRPLDADAPLAGTGGVALQIGAYKSEAEANAAWNRFARRHAQAGRYRAVTARVDLGNRGVWYRLRLADISDKSAAVALCKELKDDGGDCFLVR